MRENKFPGRGALTGTSFRSICKRVGVVFASVAVAGATVVASPVPGAVAAEGQISELGLAVVNDGTEPFDSEAGPGKDTGATNGVVRTHDTVTYSWSYRNETTGKVTFRQVLPEGASWTEASASLCDNSDDAISNNGRTLSCTFNSLESGVGSLQVKAKVDRMANGATLEQTVTAGGRTSDSVSTTVSAFPKFALTAWTSSPLPTNDGETIRYFTRVTFHAPDRGATNPDLKGLEALKSPIVFKMDLSEVPGEITVESCDGRTGTSADLRIQADQGECTATLDENKILTLSIKDADFSGTIIPERTTGGRILGEKESGIQQYFIRFGVPTATLPDNNEYKKIRFFGFDPEGLSGQSNYGDGYAPGMNPDGSDPYARQIRIQGKNAANLYHDPIRHVNPGKGLGRYSDQFTQNTSVVAGEVVKYYKRLTSWSLVPVDSPETCSAWRGEQFGLFKPENAEAVTKPNAWKNLEVIEYYSGTIDSKTALQSFSCGRVGDGAANWHSSVEAAGGYDKVTAVRARTETLENPQDTAGFFITLKRKAGIPGGTPVFVTGQNFANGGWEPRGFVIPEEAAENVASNTGYASWVASDGVAKGEWTQKPELIRPGQSYDFTFRAGTDNPFSNLPASLESTVVTIKLPACVSVTGSPNNGGMVSGTGGKADCAAEGQTITWPLGALRSGEDRDLHFKVDAAYDATLPFDGVFSAVIESPADTSGVQYRTHDVTVPINGVKMFGATQVVSPSSVVEPNQVITSVFKWINNSGQDYNDARFVQVLPYAGDGHGSTVDTELVSIPTSAVATVQMTTDPVATVVAALSADKTGNTGIQWGSPGDLSAVTAVRYIVADVPNGNKGEGVMKLRPKAYTAGKILVPVLNSLHATSATGPVEVENFAPRALRIIAAKTVSGSVDLVDSPAGSATPGGKRMNVKLSGYSFGANGVDDGGQGDDVAVTKTAVVNAAGKYSFAGVLAGKYSVSAVVPSGFEAVNNSLVVDVPAEPASVNVDGVLSVKAKTGGIKGSIVKSPDSAEVSDGVPGSVTVKVTGYGFGPDGVDNGGKGDDVAVTKTVVAKDGKYSVTGLPAGKYSVGFEGLPAGVKAGAVVSGLVVTPGKTVSAGDVSLVMPDTAEYVWDIVMAVADPVRDGMFLDMRDPRLSFTGEVNWMGVEGISTGWAVPGGAEYRPLEPIHRDAMAAFLYRMAGSPEVVVNGAPFSDIPADYLFVKEITWMKSSGVTTGYPDGSFKPHGSVNRDAMAAFMHRFCTNYSDKCAKAVNPGTVKIEAGKSFVDVPAGLQFEDDMKWLASAKISTGWVLEDGSAEYRPFEPITRDAMAAFIYRMKNNYLKKRRVG